MLVWEEQQLHKWLALSQQLLTFSCISRHTDNVCGLQTVSIRVEVICILQAGLDAATDLLRQVTDPGLLQDNNTYVFYNIV